MLIHKIFKYLSSEFFVLFIFWFLTGLLVLSFIFPPYVYGIGDHITVRHLAILLAITVSAVSVLLLINRLLTVIAAKVVGLLFLFLGLSTGSIVHSIVMDITRPVGCRRYDAFWGATECPLEWLNRPQYTSIYLLTFLVLHAAIYLLLFSYGIRISSRLLRIFNNLRFGIAILIIFLPPLVIGGSIATAYIKGQQNFEKIDTLKASPDSSLRIIEEGTFLDTKTNRNMVQIKFEMTLPSDGYHAVYDVCAWPSGPSSGCPRGGGYFSLSALLVDGAEDAGMIVSKKKGETHELTIRFFPYMGGFLGGDVVEGKYGVQVRVAFLGKNKGENRGDILDKRLETRFFSKLEFSEGLEDRDYFDGVPANYDECSKMDPIINEQDDTTPLGCDYFVSDSKKIEFNRCINELGGTIYSNGCELKYYNPDYVFPKNFEECVNSMPEKRQQYVGNICTLTIDRRWSNKDTEIVDRLMQECSVSGRVSFNTTSTCMVRWRIEAPNITF